MEIVDDESKIIIDIVIAGKLKDETADATKKASDNYLRSRELKKLYHGTSDIHW